MAAQTGAIDTVRFPCVPWECNGGTINAIPGTWTLAPYESLWRQNIKGVLCCPNRECRKAVTILFDMGNTVNGVLHLEHLQCRGCGLRCHARLLQWDTRKLYCVAYERLHDDNTSTLVKEYMHAEGRPEALAMFMNGIAYQLENIQKVSWRLVDAGLAIGYFGQESDKDLKNLTVD